MNSNKDYFKEIKHKPLILKDATCPRCNNRLGAIIPDRVWCINSNCDYGEMHIVGNGVKHLEFETDENLINSLTPNI